MRRVIVCALLMLVGPLAINAWASLDPVPTTANLWVDADGGTCTRSASPGAYANATACTAEGAFTASSGGDTVLIKGGSYGTLTFAAASKGSPVKFFGATGESVTATGLLVTDAVNVSVQGIDRLEESAAVYNSNHVWLKDTYTKLGTTAPTSTKAAGIYAQCADDTHFEHNEVEGSNTTAQWGDGIQLFPPDPVDNCHSDGITVDHAYVHDLHDYVATEDNHSDGIQISDAHGVTVKNSRFNRCGTQCVFVNDYTWPPPGTPSATDVVLENNMIGVSQSGSHTLRMGAATNYTLRNNSVLQNAYFDSNLARGTFTATGNVINFADNFNCLIFYDQMTQQSDNFGPTACTTAVTAADIPTLFVNPSTATATWDMHLKAGTNAAVNVMDPAKAPATDLDGDSRPIGTYADAGADERALADTTAPDTSITSTAIGTTTATSASFTFTGTDAVTPSGSLTFECKLDAGSYSSCTSPKAYSGLGTGSHTFSVRATDQALNTDATAAFETWTIDAAPAPTHQVLAYALDENAGTDLGDAWGSHTGTLGAGSAAPTWTSGTTGTALQFDGSNDTASTPDANDLDLNHFTMMAWVRPTSLGTVWRTILFKDGITREQWALYVSAGNSKPSVWVADPGSSAEVGLDCSSTVTTNTWVHVAGSYDGSTLKIYKNGTLCGSKPLTGTIPSSTGPLLLGNSNPRYPETLAGKIDAVKIYDTALTQAQIQGQM